MQEQLGFFAAGPAFPPGFVYRPGVISEAEESALLERVKELPFKEFVFQGYVGKRRVVSFGWRYDFNERKLFESRDIPDFLLSLREVAGRFAGMRAEELQQVLVTEYSPGSAIGWHRDKAMFGEIVGISLLSPCTFRLRRSVGTKWERVSLIAEPRSAYLLKGPSRDEWEHSIPAVDALRYSVTFRNLRPDYERFLSEA